MLLSIGQEQVSATLSTGWRGRKTLIALAAGNAASAAEGKGLSPQGLDPAKLDDVAQELELAVPLRRARLSVELADPLVHFDVAEGDFGAQSDRQLQAIATACVAELLGDAASAHEIRWDLQPGGRHLLIAAVPRALVALLATMAEERGSRLESIQPGFCRQWNAFARKLQAGAAVFAVLCGPHSVVARVAKGAIVSISVGPWTPGSDAMAPAGPIPSTLLDERAARLLASFGVESGSECEFVLVTREPAAIAASPHWQVMQASAEVP